ncbi:MAG: hypothetical protein IKN11_03730 [Bacteroidales bacterium]|nr:hypothetical protein [Bacteroidales bacterium]
MDFTVKKYCQLLDALKASGLSFKLRHDVDLLPANSLRTAQLEKERGLTATYYFRCVPESYDPVIIKQIASLGHEIGYHYESLTTCGGNLEEAYHDFCGNLEKLRQLAPIHSICMHGSPRSPWDSRDLWKHYDYHSLGIDFEPYLDTDFSDKLYLTDTGRRWDGYHVSLRDKIPQYQDLWDSQGLTFHSTDQIIGQLLDPSSRLRQAGKTLLITTHPQRWNPFGLRYCREYCTQTLKNVVKHYIIRKNKKNTQ